MRRILFAFLLLGGLAAAAEDDISKAEKAWAAAVVGKNVEAVERLLSPDLIYAHSTGAVETRSEYVGKLRTGEYNYQGIDHQSITVKLYGDAAAAHSRVRMRGVNKSGPFDHNLMMLHLWVKQGGRWVLAAHQTTRLQ